MFLLSVTETIDVWLADALLYLLLVALSLFSKVCVANGVGYTDLSGESAFNASLNKYHEEAKRTGAIIAPSVGFDCRFLFFGFFRKKKFHFVLTLPLYPFFHRTSLHSSTIRSLRLASC